MSDLDRLRRAVFILSITAICNGLAILALALREVFG